MLRRNPIVILEWPRERKASHARSPSLQDVPWRIFLVMRNPGPISQKVAPLNVNSTINTRIGKPKSSAPARHVDLTIALPALAWSSIVDCRNSNRKRKAGNLGHTLPLLSTDG